MPGSPLNLGATCVGQICGECSSEGPVPAVTGDKWASDVEREGRSLSEPPASSPGLASGSTLAEDQQSPSSRTFLAKALAWQPVY